MNAVEQSYFNALICQIKESGFDSHRHRNPIGSWFLGTFLQLRTKKNVHQCVFGRAVKAADC